MNIFPADRWSDCAVTICDTLDLLRKGAGPRLVPCGFCESILQGRHIFKEGTISSPVGEKADTPADISNGMSGSYIDDWVRSPCRQRPKTTRAQPKCKIPNPHRAALRLVAKPLGPNNPQRKLSIAINCRAHIESFLLSINCTISRSTGSKMKSKRSYLPFSAISSARLGGFISSYKERTFWLLESAGGMKGSFCFTENVSLSSILLNRRREDRI